MTLRLFVSPQGRLLIDDWASSPTLWKTLDRRLRPRRKAEYGVRLSGGRRRDCCIWRPSIWAPLPPSLAFSRGVAQAYLNRLCHTPAVEGSGTLPAIDPEAAELDAMVQQAPPMRGLEYVTADVLAHWWKELDQHVREEAAHFPGGAVAYPRREESTIARSGADVSPG